jgi:multidrug efflux pump subunit AcrA (membrane-fusion protein)
MDTSILKRQTDNTKKTKSKLKFKWKYIILAIILIIAVLGYFIVRNLLKPAATVNTGIKEERVSQGDIKIELTGDGSVNLPVKNVDFEVSGKIKTIYVEPGQEVKAGDVLAEIYNDDYVDNVTSAEIAYQKASLNLKDTKPELQLNLLTSKQTLDELLTTYEDSQKEAEVKLAAEDLKISQAEGQYKSAEASYIPMTQIPDAYSKVELESAKRTYENAKLSYENQVKESEITKKQINGSINTAKQNYEIEKQRYANSTSSSSSSLQQAQISAQEAKKALDDANEALGKTVLKAAADGKVLYISKEVGDTVTTSSSSSSGTVTSDTTHFIVMADSSNARVTTSVSESDIKNVYIDQKVEVQVESAGDGTFTGKVISISNLPKTD